MTLQKIYHQTPVGMAEIVANDNALLSVSLVDQPAGGGTMDVDPAGVPVLKKFLKELDEYFLGVRRNFSVKLERGGTSFQREVWRELENIPFGKTASYADVARAIGRPKAVRAVGVAIGKNPHWVLVPCHRVIGRDGSLTGYAGGMERKKWLLEHEKRFA